MRKIKEVLRLRFELRISLWSLVIKSDLEFSVPTASR